MGWFSREEEILVLPSDEYMKEYIPMKFKDRVDFLSLPLKELLYKEIIDSFNRNKSKYKFTTKNNCFIELIERCYRDTIMLICDYRVEVEKAQRIIPLIKKINEGCNEDDLVKYLIEENNKKRENSK
jgi:hypothetical protein